MDMWKVLIVAALLVGGCAGAAPKGEWQQVNGGWCYQTVYGCSTGPRVEPTRSNDATWKSLNDLVIGLPDFRNLPTPK